MSEQVRLKKAMIIGGILYRSGSVIEKDLIPEGLRKRANYGRLEDEEETPKASVISPPEKVPEEKKMLVRKERSAVDAGTIRRLQKARQRYE